jgi:DoxX-like protein
MNTVLWLGQIVLGAAFVAFALAHGFGAAQTQLQPGTRWIGDVPPHLLTFISVCELFGGVALIVPWVTKRQPWLTVLAAGFITVLMVFAAIFHWARGEYLNIVFNVILGSLAAFVAYGRWVIAPIKVTD